MSNVLIARTAGHSYNDKFDNLPYRNDVGMDSEVLNRHLGSPLSIMYGEFGAECGACFYNLELFSPKGEAYSVQLVEIDADEEIWSFYGTDDAFFVFCNWYVKAGGRARLVKRREAIAA
jgi:hypothetical protein